MVESVYPLLAALVHIARYPRGGMVVHGTLSGDRDDMIEAARQSLMDYTGQPSAPRAMDETDRLISLREKS